MKKLPEDFKQKWIAALRSGEYKQGDSWMYNKKEDSYCCLGVAGVVCNVPKEIMSLNPYFNIDEIDPKYSYPDLLLINSNGVRDVLMNMNDGDDAYEIPSRSFSEIADWIEQNL